MYHMWPPVVQPSLSSRNYGEHHSTFDMTTAFRNVRTNGLVNNTNSSTGSEKSMAAAVAAFNGAFSVNTLIQPDMRYHTPAAANHFFNTLLHHTYPYVNAFRPLINTSTTNSASLLSSSSSSSTSESAFVPAKKFKRDTTVDCDNHLTPKSERGEISQVNGCDENRCDTPSERSSDDSFGKYSENRCRSAFDLHNPLCPICNVSLHSSDIATHIQLELEAMERCARHSKYRTNSNGGDHHLPNKVLQENNINNIDQTCKTRYETYLRVRTSRQQRLNAKLLHRRGSRETRNCPICYQTVTTNNDEEFFYTHVQQCSKKREHLAAAATAATMNQRLPMECMNRALALQASQVAANLSHVMNGYNNLIIPPTETEETDINVVDTDTENDIINERACKRIKATTSSTSLGSSSGGGGAQELSSPNQSDTSNRCQESFNSDLSFQRSPKTPEINEIDPPKCLVCLESCVKPCVSTVCWHINCEECWMKCLKEKKLCPQCDAVTAPEHLRKIFLNKVLKTDKTL